MKAHQKSTKQDRTAQASLKSLPYDIIADKDAYHIVFNLAWESSSDLECLLNHDERRIFVSVKSENQNSASHSPCIFKAPADANLYEVRIQSRQSIHLVSIPRVQQIFKCRAQVRPQVTLRQIVA